MKPRSSLAAIPVIALLAVPVGAQTTDPTPPAAPASPDPSTLYSFGLGYGPNGAIVTSQDSVNGNWSYSYDPLDRLARAAGRGTFSYDYDRNGNRWRQNSLDGQGPSRQYPVDAANNHIANLTYDALGNVINDGTHTYTYDAENRLIHVDNGATARYDYDAFGRRVRKSTSAGSAEYLFDLAGHPVATRDPATGTWPSREVYAGERHVATYARGTTYLHHQDWLRTNRVTTLFDGTVTEMCTDLPFGDAMSCSQASGHPPTSTPFADYDRDAEAELDHTWFRQYSSMQGRWTTPDPFLGSIDASNPQSFNRYSYVLNDPVRLRDPLGLDGEFCLYLADDGVTEEERDYNSSPGECEATEGIWSGPPPSYSETITVTARYPTVDPFPITPPSWGPIFPINPYTGAQGPWRVPFPEQRPKAPCHEKPPPPAEAPNYNPFYVLGKISQCIRSMWMPVIATGPPDVAVAWGCGELERNPHAEYGKVWEPITGPKDPNLGGPCPLESEPEAAP